MKHLKVYEKSMFEKVDDNEKYIKFIKDKFQIKNKAFGDVEIDAIYDDRLRICITLGGDLKSNYILSLFDFFKSCNGDVGFPLTGEYLYYYLNLSNDFLKELDVEIDASKYNI